jgi:large repetitive protein
MNKPISSKQLSKPAGAAPAQVVQKPRAQYLNLEARILFDAAGASAADMHVDDASRLAEAQKIASEKASAVGDYKSTAIFDANVTSTSNVGQTVVVIDSRVTNFEGLLQGLDPNAIVRVIQANEDGVKVIGQLLGSTGNVSSLQIVSHGQSGLLSLGTSLLDNNSFANVNVTSELSGWRTGLTANADILLLGCDVAQGAKGQDFVQKLADITGADISASTDDTGAAALGGNWQLEFTVGNVESRIAFSSAAVTAYEYLLPAGPTSTLTVDPKPLIGSVNNKGSVTLLNTGTVGYAPYIAIAFDSTGKDPSNTTPTPTEGVSYVAGSARYLGTALPAEYILTFAGGVASSSSVATAAGVPIVFSIADFAGMADGDQLVIFKLPLGSFVTGQPDATVDFKYNVGANADSANAAAEGGGGAATQLNIVSRALFTLGDSPTGVGGAIVQGAGTVTTAAPSWFTTSYENTSREAEQVPGANDKQLFQAKLDIAPGQTVLSNSDERFISRLSIPPNISFDLSDISLRNGGGAADPIVAGTTYAVVDKVTGVAAVQNPLTKIWTSPAGNGVEIRATAPLGSYTGNLTLNVGYYIPRTIINEATGVDVPQSFDAKHTGRVKFADADDGQNTSFVADPSPVIINYQTIQIQKSLTGPTGNALDAANPAGVRSGDVITYTLNLQVGDYYGLRNVLVTDVLPDGLNYNGDAAITLSANGITKNGSLASFTPINADTAVRTINTQGVGNISVGGNGKLVLQFDVSGFAAANSFNTTALSNGAVAGDLLGDVFADNTTTGLTVGTITFTATVRDQYRVAANGNPATGTKINENDVLNNNVWISGNLIQNTNTPVAPTLVDTGVLNSDISSASTSIKDGNLLLEVYAINGIRVDSPTVPKNGAGSPIIAPGDNVTYRLRYDLTQGDYTDLNLTAFLPDPVFATTDANADGSTDAQGSAPGSSGFSKATDTITTTGISANWAQAGRYTVLGAAAPVTGGQPGVPNATAAAAFIANTIEVNTAPLAGGNKITFKLPNSDVAANPGGTPNVQTPATAEKVDILFTVRAKDSSFADELILAAQGREVSQRSLNDGATTPTPLADNRVLPVVIGQPKMVVSLGVLSTGASNQDGSVPTNGSITAGANSGLGTVGAAGTAGAAFSATVGRAGQVDGNMTGVDANDSVRFGFAIENSGTADGYNVRTQAIVPPPGYRFASNTSDVRGAGNNFEVRRGDGTLLVEGTDYTVSGNVVSFIDRDLDGDTIIDTFFESGKPNGVTRTDGKNVVVITFDTVVDNSAASIAFAGATATATVGVDRVTGSPTGTTTNFAAIPVTDTATVQNAKPQADIRWQGDSTDADKTATADDTVQANDGAANDQMVIGDRGYFDLKITIPEGQTKGLFADVNLPLGMRLDPSFNSGAGYEIISTAAGTGVNGAGLNGQLAADFGGTITNATANVANIAPIGGTLGQPGVGARINLGDITNPSTTATNSTANNSFIIRVRAVADNQIANQLNVPQTLASGSRYTEGVDVVAGTGGTATNVANTSTANDPTVTIAEPVVTTVTTVTAYDIDSNTPGAQAGTQVDQFDIVEYTIRLANPGSINAFDLAFNDVFPSYLVNDSTLQIASVTSGSALVNGVAATLSAADFSLNTGTRTLNFNNASNIDLLAGGFIEIKVRGTVNASAAAVPSFTNSAETTWTSLNDAGSATSLDERSGTLGIGPLLANGGTTINDGTGASSATVVDQTATGNGLNNYRSASSATIPVVAIVPVLSRIGGLIDTSTNANNNLSGDTKDGSPSAGTPQSMAVGEVVRFRMVARIPSGLLNDVALQPTLPAGYTFLNDNTARVAFVSDTGIVSSTLSGPGLTKGDGTAPNTAGDAAIFGSIQNNLTNANFGVTDPRAAAVTPTFALTSANIAGTGASPLFKVGNITNNDNDIDDEFIVIEFNAVVNNIAANQQGTNLDTSFVVRLNASTSNDQIGSVSNITRDTVVEPYIATVNKQIVDFAAPTQGNPNTNITLADSFTNSGLAPAFDVTLVDAGMPTGVNPAFGSVTVGTITYGSIASAGAAGIIVASNGNGFNVTVPKLGVGESVTLRYSNDVPANANQPSDATTAATVTYTSTPGLTQTFGASTNGLTGAATGERNGTGAGLPASAIPVADGSGALNNYSAADTAGFGVVSGTLWNDTGLSSNMAGTSANDTIDVGEQRLAGVTVSLLWAGPDGDYATSADNRTLTTTTNATGQYSFGALPSGNYRITTGTTVAGVALTDAAATGDTDTLTMRFDRDGATLGTIDVVLADGASQATRDFGFVEANDAPTVPTQPANYGTVNDNASKPVNGITFADIDGNATTLETVSIVVGNGTTGLGSLSAITGSGVTVVGSGSQTLSLRGTLTDINAFIAANKVAFTPVAVAANSNEVIHFTINDEGSRGDFNANGLPSQAGGTASPDARTATADIGITIITPNQAPFVRIGTTTPNPVNIGSQIGAVEDTTLTFTGTNLISIGDPNDEGTSLAVTLTVPSGVGTLNLPSSPLVTVSAGASGTNTITINGKLADLNAALAALSFTPSADVNTTATPSTLTILIVDSGNGGYGGTLSNAVINQVIKLPITPINDAPAFSITTLTSLPAVNEDTTSAEVSVATAFPGYSDPKDLAKPNGVDNRVGVLLVNNASTAAQGDWQYLNGTVWTAVPRNLSGTNALYLPDATQLRFVPTLNYNGTPGVLTARLVEDDQTTTAATQPDLPATATGSTFGATNVIRIGLDLSAGVGGTSRVSANTRDVGIVINPVNELPTVTAPGGNVAAGLAIGDTPVSFTGANSIVVADPSDFPNNDGPVVCVIITPTANGRPYMSALVPGVTQLSGPAVGTLPATAGTPITLEGTLANLNLALQKLEYRSAPFYNGLDSFTVKIDDKANGGPGPLTAIATVNINNVPLNDRPVVNGPEAPLYDPLLPGMMTPPRTVQEIFGQRFTDPRDAPTNNGGDVFAGVAVIGTPPVGQGTYQYSSDGGATWKDIAPSTTPANAVVLAPTALVRFKSNAAYIGTTDTLKAVLIETDQKAPFAGDLLSRASVPLDTATSVVPATGTIIDLSKLEATETSTTNNGIGRSRFSSLTKPMEITVRIDPPASSAAVPNPLQAFVPIAVPSLIGLSNDQAVGSVVAESQSLADLQTARGNTLFNQGLGNSGLQPNWLAAEGVPGIDPFAAPPAPVAQPAQPIVVPEPAKPAAVLNANSQVDDCAKPRVVAKPRIVKSTPRFAPGSEAAKRFSDQVKRARVRSRC